MIVQGSGAGKTVTAEPRAATVVQSAVGVSPPPGAPPGGAWIVDKYCGITTWIVGIFLLPCVCCCPCDDRTVYVVNGVKYNTFGAVVPDGLC